MKTLGILKSRPLTTVGIILLMFGFIGPATLGPLDVRNEGDVGGLNPSGSQNSPTVFAPGQSVKLKMNSWNAKVDNPRVVINGDIVPLTYNHVNSSHYGSEYIYTASWTAPSSSDQPIEFRWKGDYNGTSTDTTYAVISGGKENNIPEGYFQIEGGSIDPLSSPEQTTKTEIDFKFISTSGVTPDSMWITVEGVSGTAYSKSDTTKYWPASTWTLNFSKGSYIVKGCFEKGGETYEDFTLNLGVKEEPEPIPTPSSGGSDYYFYSKIIGMIAIIGGFLLKK